jgi:hypothetical protein
MKYVLFLFLIALNLSSVAQYPIEGYHLDNPTFLDSTIDNYKVFLSSEIHWNKDNDNRRKYIIRYLTGKKSLNKIVLERSYAFGHWINYFIQTRDTLFLKELLANYNTRDYRKGVKYIDSYDFYLWLRTFIVFEGLSISVTGLDLEFLNDPKSTMWSFLKFVELNVDLQNQLNGNIEDAKSLLIQEKIKLNEFKKWFNQLQEKLSEVNINDTHFLNFIYNIKQSIPFAKGTKMEYREQQLFDNFNKYVSNGEKVYGQFGLPHITLKDGKRTSLRSFASLLNETVEYSGKILSIGLICFNCTMAEFKALDYYAPFLTQEEFNRLKPELIKLPNNTFVDLRQTNEIIKEYTQLLLIVYE